MKKYLLIFGALSLLLLSCENNVLFTGINQDTENLVDDYDLYEGFRYRAYDEDGQRFVPSDERLYSIFFGRTIVNDGTTSKTITPMDEVHPCGHSPEHGCSYGCWEEGYYYNCYVHNSEWTYQSPPIVIVRQYDPPGAEPPGVYALTYYFYYCNQECCTRTVNILQHWIPA